MDLDPAALADLFYGDEASGPAKAQQLAEALRGQQQMGLLGQLTGDKVLGGVGQSLLAGAQQGQQALQKAADMRLSRAIEAERGKRDQAFQQAQMAHMTNEEGIEKARLAQGRFSLSSPTPTSPGYVIDQRTGQAKPLLAAAPGKPGGDSKEEAEQLKELAKSLNRDTFRGNIPKAQERLNTAGRVRNAILDENGNIKDLSPAMIQEVVGSTASLVAPGTPGEHTLQSLMPKGRGIGLANLEEWLTNEPHGAGQQAFLKQMLDLADREDKTVGGQIREAQLRQLPRFAPYFKKYGDTFWNAAHGHIGVDPRTLVDPETLLPIEKPKGGGAAGGGGLSAADQKAVDWAKKNPNNPDAQAILKMHPTAP